MHRSRLSTFVLDCNVDDLAAAAEFWSKALNRPLLPPEPDEPNYLRLSSSEDEPILYVQKVDHDSRIHLDIETDDLEAEVTRLEQLGARRLTFVRRWWLMQAPTGQVFCVLNPQRGPLADKPNANQWE
ncbi:MAG: VOC family protein [Deltaproteobacteria bacterium]|nr:MAG: VOC family protein [Deltaproteobacteria bacterium]TMQ21398.1 MAG: VOC family protein [Deltaproteobacteria bacterium]